MISILFRVLSLFSFAKKVKYTDGYIFKNARQKKLPPVGQFFDRPSPPRRTFDRNKMLIQLFFNNKVYIVIYFNNRLMHIQRTAPDYY